MHAERDIVMTNQSVCSLVFPSARPMPVLCLKEWTFRHSFSPVW